MRPIYLASQSPRRSQLLTQIGVPHQLLLPQATDAEDTPEAMEALEASLPNETPAAMQRVTRLKLAAAQQRAQRQALVAAPILCADTTVALGPVILGKPVDAHDAEAMLRQLSGTTHEVLTAVAVAHAGDVRQALSVSRVRFDTLTDATRRRYIESGEWQGKAGAYGVQGLAAILIAHIEGSHSGIMGLPLYETHQLLLPWLQQQGAT